MSEQTGNIGATPEQERYRTLTDQDRYPDSFERLHAALSEARTNENRALAEVARLTAEPSATRSVLHEHYADLYATWQNDKAKLERYETALAAASRYLAHLRELHLHEMMDARVLDDYYAWGRALARAALASTTGEPTTEQGEDPDAADA